MTRSLRVIWLCEELGIDYQAVPVDFSPEYRATPQWRALNPVGKVPVMIDGNTTMFESGAMVQHLLDTRGPNGLEPERGTTEHAHYLQWCWFGESTFARPLGEIVNHNREFPNDQAIPEVLAEMTQRVAVSVGAVAAATANQDWLLDDFSAADIMVGYSVFLVSKLTPQLIQDNITPYWERIQARPAFQRTLAV